MNIFIKIIFTAILMDFSACGNKNHNTSTVAVFFMDEKEISIGRLIYQLPGLTIINYYNQGKKPLIIHNILTSYGCILPSWSMKAIRPKESGNLTINYDSQPGRFLKTITVHHYGSNSPFTFNVNDREVMNPDSIFSK